MIKVQHLSKSFGPSPACRDISFDALPASTIALIGPNGAGKTTLLKMLSGTLIQDSGSISIHGFDTRDHPLLTRSLTGYMGENTPLYTDMTVTEHFRFIAGMRGIGKKQAYIEEEQALHRHSLLDVRSTLVGSLSKGYKQRVSLALALIGDPPVLILDEPTNGLDPIQMEEFRLIIRELSAKKTIIISTHLMMEVESLCNDVVLIHEGEIVEKGSLIAVCERSAAASIGEAFSKLTAMSSSEKKS